jgi:hypothetical protein
MTTFYIAVSFCHLTNQLIHLVGCRTFKLYLVIRTTVLMAEQTFMFATTAGFMIGLGVLLFIVRGRSSKGVKATISGHDEGDKGRKEL